MATVQLTVAPGTLPLDDVIADMIHDTGIKAKPLGRQQANGHPLVEFTGTKDEVLDLLLRYGYTEQQAQHKASS